MLRYLYKRRAVVALVLAAVLTLLFVLLFWWERPESLEEAESLIVIGFTAFFMFVIGISSWGKYRSTQEFSPSVSDVSPFDVEQIVIKRDASIIIRQFLFHPDGRYLGRIEPEKLPFYSTVLFFLMTELQSYFPVQYAIYDQQGRRVGGYRSRGFWNRELSMFDADGKPIGRYTEQGKHVVNRRGELYDEENQKLMETFVSGATGNFTLKDENERQWVSYRQGMFPPQYTKHFRDVYNPIIYLNKDLNEKERLLTLSMVGFWFLQMKE